MWAARAICLISTLNYKILNELKWTVKHWNLQNPYFICSKQLVISQTIFYVGRQCSACRCSDPPWVRIHVFHTNALRLISGSYSPHLKTVLKLISLSSQTSIIHNKQDDHCTIKFCWSVTLSGLSGPRTVPNKNYKLKTNTIIYWVLFHLAQ